MNDWQTCVGNCQPIKTPVLFTWFICVILCKMADASQDESEATFKFIEEVHNCPAAWDISSVVCKVTKNKQKKMEELADKLSFVQAFLAFCFFSSFFLFHCSTWVPLHQVGHVANYRVLGFDANLTCEGASLSTFWSLPTRVCQLKFAVWRPRKTRTPTAQAHVFLTLAQFRDCYDNQHKTEALFTNKPWTIYTSTSRLI